MPLGNIWLPWRKRVRRFCYALYFYRQYFLCILLSTLLKNVESAVAAPITSTIAVHLY